MSASGPSGPSIAGLFRSAWRPKKAVVVLWRRVETIDPEAYAELMEWVRAHRAADETFRWLEAMATNEVHVDADEAIDELARVLDRQPPEPIRSHAVLLCDLIWEASEPDSSWLRWPQCRVCGRRWAVVDFEGVPLCPQHANATSLLDYIREESRRYPGLVRWPPRIIAFLAQMSRRVELETEQVATTEAGLLNGAAEHEQPTTAKQPLAGDTSVVAPAPGTPSATHDD